MLVSIYQETTWGSIYLCASQICRYQGSCVVLYTVVQEQKKSERGAINNQEDLGHYLTKSN